MPAWLASAAPAIISGAASMIGGQSANKATARLVQYQTEFQREMANTAHQRQVADLRAAGLNPILSAGGGGADSPSGASATMEDVITPAVSTALASRMASQELRNLKQQENLLLQQNEKTYQEGKEAAIRANLLRDYGDAQANAALDNVRAQTELSSSSAEGNRQFNESLGGAIKALGPLGQVIGPLLRMFGGRR